MFKKTFHLHPKNISKFGTLFLGKQLQFEKKIPSTQNKSQTEMNSSTVLQHCQKKQEFYFSAKIIKIQIVNHVKMKKFKVKIKSQLNWRKDCQEPTIPNSKSFLHL